MALATGSPCVELMTRPCTVAPGWAAAVMAARSSWQRTAAGRKRMTGSGPYAWMVGRRFEAAAAKLGFAKSKVKLRSDLFTPPKRVGDQLQLELFSVEGFDIHLEGLVADCLFRTTEAGHRFEHNINVLDLFGPGYAGLAEAESY